MSNLGGYQLITTVIKKFGGPRKFLIITMGGSAAIGGIMGGVIVEAKHKIINVLEDKRQNAEAAIVHHVTIEGVSNEGLRFNKGDQFKVLECANDAWIIERIGDANNPYCVSGSFIKSISDYPNKK